MAITPQSQLFLLKVPISLDNKNQLTFRNSISQRDYFASLTHLQAGSFSYIRKDNIIRFPAHIDNIIEFNYVMYQNENYTNKWFYAFITNMEYVNDNMTNIYIKTDVFQTWQFNLIYKRMFVEREHVNDDIVGKYTVPENVETGDYIVDEIIRFSDLDDFKYVIQVTEWSTSGDKPLATNFGGIFYAGGAYICDNISQVVNILQQFANDGKSDSVYGLYMCPSLLINNTSGSLQYSGQNSPMYGVMNIDKPRSLHGYTPVNKKLLTFPYCFLTVSNNNGSSNNFMYDLFYEIDESPNQCIFNIKGVPTIGTSTKCVPFNYKNGNEEDNEEEGIIGGKFPTLSWSEDAYINWLTQNAVNIGIGTASNLLTIVGGLGMMATGSGAIAGASSIVSGSLGIASQLGQIYEHSLTPNSAQGNTNCGDINSCTNANTFYFYKKCIKNEYAKIIDDFFTMFGYKINSVKIPNINGRPNWNYVKTIDANITANIPQNDLIEIKEIFNNGVTFWHNPSTFLNYSQNNK